MTGSLHPLKTPPFTGGSVFVILPHIPFMWHSYAIFNTFFIPIRVVFLITLNCYYSVVSRDFVQCSLVTVAGGMLRTWWTDLGVNFLIVSAVGSESMWKIKAWTQ